MRILNYFILIIICFAILSCEQKHSEQKYPQLDKAVEFIKARYSGDVKASIENDKEGKKYLRFDLTDTTSRINRNMEDFSSEIFTSIYSAISKEQRENAEFIEIIFFKASEIYFHRKVLMSQLKKEEAIRQIKYCNILPNILSNDGLQINLDEVSEEEFYGLTPDSLRNRNIYQNQQHKANDSLERVLLSNYRSEFHFNDSCYTFSSFGNTPIHFCRRQSSDDDRNYEYYEVWGKEDDFFVFGVGRYEEGECVVFNSKLGKAFYMNSYPILSLDKKLMYSVGSNMYEEALLDIRRLTDNKAISLAFAGWYIYDNSLIGSEGVRFRLVSSKCDQKNRYIIVRMNN